MRTHKKYKDKVRNFTADRERLHDIIFEADSWEGRLFDIILIIAILLSILIVSLETVPYYHNNFGATFYAFEWIFTIIFTIEYALRLYSAYRPWKYALSFYGIVDFLSILPTYVSLFFGGAQSLMMIRALRLLRVFRIFKLVNITSQGNFIIKSLQQSKEKIFVFLFFVLIIICVFGSIMFVIENPSNSEQFSSIPTSIYWAIVTLTTVGYGDISPVTTLGQILASFIMIMGYAVIAVPTGIVASDFVNMGASENGRDDACPYCARAGHAGDAAFCKYCGEELEENV